MPQVVLWVGNEKKVIDVHDPVPDYVYMYPPLPPLCSCNPRKPKYDETVRILRYKVRPMCNPRTGERWYEGTLVE